MKCKICNKEVRYFRKHLKDEHNLTDIEYYIRYCNSGIVPICKCCGKPVTKFKDDTFDRGPVDYCSINCKNKNHSLKMKQLHKYGVYAGTSKITNYNKSKTHRLTASLKAKARRLNKESTAFNSEYSDRIRNRDNIRSRYNSEENRYLYVLEYDDKIKVGSTSKLDRRLNELTGFNDKHIYKGTVYNISGLECNILLKFKDYTLLDETGSYYTEYLDKTCLSDVLAYITNNL